jgi:hypothetical protein
MKIKTDPQDKLRIYSLEIQNEFIYIKTRGRYKHIYVTKAK